MSIEKDLSRIADALEKIVEIAHHPLRKIESAQAPVAQVSPASDLPPGVEETETVTLPTPTGMDAAGLRDLAQKYIAVAGEKTGALVNFIKDSICKKFSPTEPKLVKIPAKDIPAAVKLLEGYCKKAGIVIPVEV